MGYISAPTRLHRLHEDRGDGPGPLDGGGAQVQQEPVGRLRGNLGHAQTNTRCVPAALSCFISTLGGNGEPQTVNLSVGQTASLRPPFTQDAEVPIGVFTVHIQDASKIDQRSWKQICANLLSSSV